MTWRGVWDGEWGGAWEGGADPNAISGSTSIGFSVSGTLTAVVVAQPIEIGGGGPDEWHEVGPHRAPRNRYAKPLPVAAPPPAPEPEPPAPPATWVPPAPAPWKPIWADARIPDVPVVEGFGEAQEGVQQAVRAAHEAVARAKAQASQKRALSLVMLVADIDDESAVVEDDFAARALRMVLLVDAIDG